MKAIYLFTLRLGASYRAYTRRSTFSFTVRSAIQQLFTMSTNNNGSIHRSRQISHDVTSSTVTKTPVTTEWKTLVTQVGGHQFAQGEYEHQKLGIVDIGNGLILKSLQNPPRGKRELNFYQNVFSPACDDVDLLELRPFLSPFYGTEEKGGAKFLKLANLTSGFKCPCVIDLKMGRVTYDQEATAEKIAHEVEKYPPLKSLGFQITGMMIYNPGTQSNEQYGKPYCRILTEENITHDGLGRFFQLHNNDLRRDVIQQLVLKLKKLESWFLKQKKYSFIASSLLIVYEGLKSTENRAEISGRTNPNKNIDNPTSTDTQYNFPNANPHSDPAKDIIIEAESSSSNVYVQKRMNDGKLVSGDDSVKNIRRSEGSRPDADVAENSSSAEPHGRNECLSTKEVEVHLIDFAHAFPTKDIDHNFVFGLQKVIACLETLLK